jgi:aminopeptidase N
MAQTTLHHELQVTLEPDDGYIAVQDHIRLPRPMAAMEGELTFTLNTAMEPAIIEPPARLVAKVRHGRGSLSITHYTVSLPEGAPGLTLRYQGRLGQRLANTQAPAPADTPLAAGHIGPDGVYLSAASHWLPRIDDGLISFSLEIDLPTGWVAVSQGKRSTPERRAGRSVVRWVEHQPQDDLIVAANRFHAYRRSTPHADALAFLLRPERELADRYLEATARYLDLYSRLIGPYPYAKFALVENFWETGYGFPSFTLLGSRVVRLPFIIHSAYPHEILHNWWGNGVYVDYGSGNWSEGLTAYLADHQIQEQRGRGAEQRRSALQKYRNYVGREQDFALSEFRAKHGEASEAVGYNKALMFFHMLRRRLGDRLFIDGLRRFYAEQRFRVAGYSDLQAAFEAVSGLELEQDFDQWVTRVGAPALRLRDARVEATAAGYRLSARLEQSQDGPAYSLQVPVAVQLEGRGFALRRALSMDEKTLDVSLSFDRRPLRFAVDPEFDLFRRLDAAEVPAALGELFGSDDALFVLPAAAPDSVREAYRGLASRFGAARVISDTNVAPLPSDRPVWILGWENRHRAALAQKLLSEDVSFEPRGVRIHGELHLRDGECTVLVGRRSGGGRAALAWIGCEIPEAFPGLARKLPHYGKYGYLSFAGSEPENVLKGQWQVSESPLNMPLHPESEHFPLNLAPRPSLLNIVDTP